jgi:hypothetical protein
MALQGGQHRHAAEINDLAGDVGQCSRGHDDGRQHKGADLDGSRRPQECLVETGQPLKAAGHHWSGGVTGFVT